MVMVMVTEMAVVDLHRVQAARGRHRVLLEAEKILTLIWEVMGIPVTTVTTMTVEVVILEVGEAQRSRAMPPLVLLGD